MTATDWIALVQAGFLAAAAIFAWRGYRLAVGEWREAREEARKAPLRELVADVIREVKELASQADERVMPAGIQRLDLIAGRQKRLAVAITFVPPNVFNIFVTRELTTCAPQDVTEERITNASNELLTLFARIERGEFSILQAAPAAYQQVEGRAQ